VLFIKYGLPYVLRGTYTVRALATGFNTKTQENVIVVVSASRRLNFKLTVGSSTQTVTVIAAAPSELYR
jgi:hypothetical protein